jgi:hypothetical protein
MLDANISQLVLELGQLREVGDQLRSAGVAKLECSEQEAAGDRERRQRLENDLQDLKLGRHGQ